MNKYEVTVAIGDIKTSLNVNAETEDQAKDKARERIVDALNKSLTSVGALPVDEAASARVIEAKPAMRRFTLTMKALVDVTLDVPGDFDVDHLQDQLESMIDPMDLSTHDVLSLERSKSREDEENPMDIGVSISVEQLVDYSQGCDDGWVFREVS